jgi:hypothetical protein
LLYKQYEEISFEVSAQYSPGGKENHTHTFPENKKQGLIIFTG